MPEKFFGGSCRFCDAPKTQQDRILEVGTNAYVMFSDPRLMPGHLLVIPKRHLSSIMELGQEEQEEILAMLKKYETKILAQVAKGCDIVQNFRPFQEESQLKVQHLHFHLKPRDLYDELYTKAHIHETPLFKPLSEQEKAALKSRLAL